MNLYKYPIKFDLDKLLKEKDYAESVVTYDSGFRNHCISLLGRKEEEMEGWNLYLVEMNRHRNDTEILQNIPFDRKHLPYMNSVFDIFNEGTEVLVARLMRRESHSSYSIHRDYGKGMEELEDSKKMIWRFQIPLISNKDCYLIIFKDHVVDKWKELYGEYQLEDFLDKPSDNFQVHRLEDGYLHHFKAWKYAHTVWNWGETDRYTLAVDTIPNEWIENWAKENLNEVLQ
jgi:hypothetical protein